MEEIKIQDSLPLVENEFSDKDFFEAIDLNYKGLSKVKNAYENNDIETAKLETINYFKNRQNVAGVYDYRNGKSALDDMKNKTYLWQHFGSYNGTRWDYINKAVKRLYDNIYLFSNGREMYLGENFELFPVHSTEEINKINQTNHLLFTRGHVFEILAFYFQETRDEKVILLFEKFTKKFFETYNLIMEELSPHSFIFQYSHNRESMNIGWLVMSYINILNTDILYHEKTDKELVFEMIKRIYFLSVQFRRYDSDEFSPHNHHFFERGVVPYFVSMLLPEFPMLNPMVQRGKEVILEHLKKDYNEHGEYSEHSIGYAFGATIGEMLCKVLAIAKNEEDDFFDDESKHNINMIFDLVVKAAPPDDIYPAIGDGGGTVVDMMLKMGRDLLDSKMCSDTIECRENNLEINYPKYLNLKSGFAIMRNNYKKDGSYVIMATRDNTPYSGHDHIDMLSLIVYFRGKLFFDETYACEIYKKFIVGKPPRGFLYNMTSHNTVLAHGAPIVEDVFFEKAWCVLKPDTKITEFIENERSCYLAAHHNGYTYARVEREVLFVDDIGVVVSDCVFGGVKIDSPHISRWFLANNVKHKNICDNVYLFENDGVKILVVWQGDNVSFDIYKPDFLDGYVDEKNIEYIFDVKFKIKEEESTFNWSPRLNTIMLDVTEKEIDNIYIEKIKKLDCSNLKDLKLNLN